MAKKKDYIIDKSKRKENSKNGKKVDIVGQKKM